MRRSPIAWILALSFVAACSGDDSLTPVDAPSTSESTDSPTTTYAEVANPASQFCALQGGTIEVVAEGQEYVSYCLLPNGDRVEENLYFETNKPKDVKAALPILTIEDRTTGWYPALEIGADGNPVISHHDREKGDLLVTHCDNPECSSATLRILTWMERSVYTPP